MRWLLFVALVCLGCGSDDGDEPANTGGTSGSGGSAGSSAGGSAGSSSGGSGGGFPAPVPDDCITDVSPKPDHVYQCSGLSWNVSVPDACITQACGLIFDVHGFTMSGQMENANTQLAALGATHGYIVVQPNADPAPPAAGWAAADDDPKIFDFIQRTSAAFHTDPKRLHFTGFSQGGDMSWRFICNHSDIIASAAPAAFGHSENENCFSKGTAPARELPILFMHGTADALVPIASAIAARDAVISVQGMSETDTVSSDAGHVWTRYQNPAGTVFEFLQHEYTGVSIIGGHCYPGSTDPSGAPGQLFSFKCDQPAAFVWGEAAMAFFQAHPME
jgi:dienelactone hydrolase